MLAAWMRVLAPGGRVVIYEDWPRTWFDRLLCAKHEREWRERTGPCTFHAIDAWPPIFEAARLTVLKARPLAWGAAASSAVVGASAAGVFITTVPHHHSPVASPRPSVPSAIQPLTPQGQAPAHTGHRVRARVVASPAAPGGSGHPASTGQPRPAPTSPGTSTAPAPSPSSAPSPAQPSPSPSPSGGVCVIVLGIRVCVPPVGVSVGS